MVVAVDIVRLFIYIFYTGIGLISTLYCMVSVSLRGIMGGSWLVEEFNLVYLCLMSVLFCCLIWFVISSTLSAFDYGYRGYPLHPPKEHQDWIDEGDRSKTTQRLLL